MRVSGRPTFHRANLTVHEFKVTTTFGGLTPIGDTLVTTLYSFKELFGQVSEEYCMTKILSELAMHGLGRGFLVLIFVTNDSGRNG